MTSAFENHAVKWILQGRGSLWASHQKEKQAGCCAEVMACCAKPLQSCPALCGPLDCNLRGSSVRGFSRRERWSGLPFPSPGDLPDPGIKPMSLMSPASAGGFFTTSTTWEGGEVKSCLQNGGRALPNGAPALVNSLISDCFPSCSLNSKYTDHIYSLSNHFVDSSWVPSLGKTLLWVSSN